MNGLIQGLINLYTKRKQRRPSPSPSELPPAEDQIEKLRDEHPTAYVVAKDIAERLCGYRGVTLTYRFDQRGVQVRSIAATFYYHYHGEYRSFGLAMDGAKLCLLWSPKRGPRSPVDVVTTEGDIGACFDLHDPDSLDRLYTELVIRGIPLDLYR